MNLSIAEEFLKFKKLFFVDSANNKKLIANLKNKIHSQNNEFQNLKHKIFALNHEVKGLQDQILILEEKFRNLSEDKQDHAIQEWLQSLEKNGNIKVIKHGGNN